MENKQKICDLLARALQETRDAGDLLGLEYDAEKELVTATFAGGGKRIINVALDSGTAMIRDIVNHFCKPFRMLTEEGESMKDVIALRRYDSASSTTYDRVIISAAKNKSCFIVTVRGPGEGFNISCLDEEETAGQMETLASALVCGGYERE